MSRENYERMGLTRPWLPRVPYRRCYATTLRGTQCLAAVWKPLESKKFGTCRSHQAQLDEIYQELKDE